MHVVHNLSGSPFRSTQIEDIYGSIDYQRIWRPTRSSASQTGQLDVN